MSDQVGFYVNQQFCMGCKTCQIACKDKHDNEVGVNFQRLKEISGGGFTKKGAAFHSDVWAYWLGVSCNHCDNPACVAVCPTGALDKSSVDGTVSVDAADCIGCKRCTSACPYGAPQYSVPRHKVGKCDLCADYRAQSKEPACVAACPMRVLEWGRIDELRKKHPEATSEVHGLPTPKTTSPNTIYTPHRHAVAAKSDRS